MWDDSDEHRVVAFWIFRPNEQRNEWKGQGQGISSAWLAIACTSICWSWWVSFVCLDSRKVTLPLPSRACGNSTDIVYAWACWTPHVVDDYLHVSEDFPMQGSQLPWSGIHFFVFPLGHWFRQQGDPALFFFYMGELAGFWAQTQKFLCMTFMWISKWTQGSHVWFERG